MHRLLLLTLAVLAGSLLDVGFETATGIWSVHSYVGFPLTVLEKGDEDTRYREEAEVGPEWELGVQFRTIDDFLFVGAMFSVPFLTADESYMGVIMRLDYDLVPR